MKGLINIRNEDNQWYRLCLVRYLNSVNKNPPNIRIADNQFAKPLDLKDVKFHVHKKRLTLKQKSKIIFPLMYLVIKMKYHNRFILQNKLLKNMLIYYYYRFLILPVVLQLNI